MNLKGIFARNAAQLLKLKIDAVHAEWNLKATSAPIAENRQGKKRCGVPFAVRRCRACSARIAAVLWKEKAPNRLGFSRR